jgi:hypothetical protein
VGSPSAKALLLALANFADEHGRNCFPGQEALSDLTEFSLDTIQRQLSSWHRFYPDPWGLGPTARRCAQKQSVALSPPPMLIVVHWM